MAELTNILPLRLLKPVRANEVNGAVGVFYPIGSPTTPALLFPWDGEPCVLNLDGGKPFKFYLPKMNGSVHGLLVTGCEFIVDITSLYRPVNKPELPGALVIKDDEIFIVGQNENGMMADWSPVPTGMTLGEGSNSAGQEFRFARWQLVKCDGDRTFELFNFPGANP